MEKPKMVSLFATMNIERFSMKDAEDLLSLPRLLGNDPADGEPITAQNGRFGPYISKGKDSRTISSEEQLLTITLDEALALLAQPRTFGRIRLGNGPANIGGLAGTAQIGCARCAAARGQDLLDGGLAHGFRGRQ